MAFRLNPQLFNPSLYKKVRSMWFSDLPEKPTAAPPSAMQRWFSGGPPEVKAAFDQLCRETVGAALESIGPEQYALPPFRSFEEEERNEAEIAGPFLDEIKNAEQPETPASTALSLVLILDQMTRNIFRTDQKLIYTHYDRFSRALSHTMLSSSEIERWDLSPLYRESFVYRMWFYMPLMHSEYIQDHERALRCMAEAEKEVAETGGEGAADLARKTHDSEMVHFNILKRFGRYPHRNQSLGRTPTPQEKEYLEGGGVTFGTG